MKLFSLAAPLTALALLAAVMTSCSDSKSYSELLTEENQYVNHFLSDQRVVDYFPEDSYEVGPDAPYYKMDEEGNVYMQILDPGNDQRPEKDNRVYFRFTRFNLARYETGEGLSGLGNADDISGGNGLGSMYFLYENYTLAVSYQYGTGIQIPMRYLGSNAKVNLVVKSQYGWTNETANVIPFLYNIRYYESPMFPWTSEPVD
nr:DUF4827 domain-containing protein [Bacteroides sp.]